MPGDERSRGATPRPATSTLDELTVPPSYPIGGDPLRRLHWHHRLVRRRRWSKAFDDLLTAETARTRRSA
jgi:hypothetical protein